MAISPLVSNHLQLMDLGLLPKIEKEEGRINEDQPALIFDLFLMGEMDKTISNGDIKNEDKDNLVGKKETKKNDTLKSEGNIDLIEKLKLVNVSDEKKHNKEVKTKQMISEQLHEILFPSQKSVVHEANVDPLSKKSEYKSDLAVNTHINKISLANLEEKNKLLDVNGENEKKSEFKNKVIDLVSHKSKLMKDEGNVLSHFENNHEEIKNIDRFSPAVKTFKSEHKNNVVKEEIASEIKERPAFFVDKRVPNINVNSDKQDIYTLKVENHLVHEEKPKEIKNHYRKDFFPLIERGPRNMIESPELYLGKNDQVKDVVDEKIISDVKNYITHIYKKSHSETTFQLNHKDIGKMDIHIDHANPQGLSVIVHTDNKNILQFLTNNTDELCRELKNNGVLVSEILFKERNELEHNRNERASFSSSYESSQADDNYFNQNRSEKRNKAWEIYSKGI
jgi:hypothetical protein